MSRNSGLTGSRIRRSAVPAIGFALALAIVSACALVRNEPTGPEATLVVGQYGSSRSVEFRVSSVRAIPAIAILIALVSCGMLPMDRNLYEYRAATHTATVTINSWPENPGALMEYDEYGGSDVWVYAVVDGPPDSGIIGHHLRN